MMQSALLLIAHGSRREASNDEVRELAQRLGQMAGECFGHTEAAFLELAEPSIPDGISQCVTAGAERVVVVPHFLSAGRHVARDIPAELGIAQARHPDVEVVQSDYLGSHPQIARLLLQLAESAGG